MNIEMHCNHLKDVVAAPQNIMHTLKQSHLHDLGLMHQGYLQHLGLSLRIKGISRILK